MKYLIIGNRLYTCPTTDTDTTWSLPEDYAKWSHYASPTPCKHEHIDNGTRLSECRHCKTTMRLKGFDWIAE
jgi:hypothetical protein